MAKLTGAHLFVRCLKLEGIEKIFTIVGDTILPLVDAAADEGIEFIDTRHPSVGYQCNVSVDQLGQDAFYLALPIVLMKAGDAGMDI